MRLTIAEDSPILLALESAGAIIETDKDREAIAGAINAAILQFIHARDEAVPQPELHAQIKRFRTALGDFLRELTEPDAPLGQIGSPLGRALSEEWARAEQAHQQRGCGPYGGVDDLTDAWNFAFPHPAAFEGLRRGLSTLALAVDALAEEEQLGRGKPPYREDQRLVLDLRSIFEKTTTRKARRSVRNQWARYETNDQRTRAQGEFGLFTRAVDDELFRAIVNAFTTQPVMRENGRARSMTAQEAEAEAGKYRIRGLAAMIATVLKDNQPKSAD